MRRRHCQSNIVHCNPFIVWVPSEQRVHFLGSGGRALRENKSWGLQCISLLNDEAQSLCYGGALSFLAKVEVLEGRGRSCAWGASLLSGHCVTPICVGEQHSSKTLGPAARSNHNAQGSAASERTMQQADHRFWWLDHLWLQSHSSSG